MAIQVIEGRNGQYVRIEDVRVKYCNFKGVGNDYNREGDRNFNVVIRDVDDANALSELGLNVKPDIIDPEDPERNTWKLMVRIKYRTRDGKPVRVKPDIRLLNSKGVLVPFTEETIGELDSIDIENVTLVINLYRYSDNGNASAYLSDMVVYPRPALLGDIYAKYEYPQDDEVPFGE
jgi:hypothetical protein